MTRYKCVVVVVVVVVVFVVVLFFSSPSFLSSFPALLFLCLHFVGSISSYTAERCFSNTCAWI